MSGVKSDKSQPENRFEETEKLKDKIDLFAQNEWLEIQNKELIKKLQEKERRVEEYKEFEEQIHNIIERIKGELEFAMSLVVGFSHDHKSHLSRIVLGLADNTFRFVFLTKGEGFDWDLSDAIAGLEANIAEKCPTLPLSCIPVPESTEKELGPPIIEEQLSELPTKE